MKKFISVLISNLCLFVAACSTIVHGRTQEIVVASNPEGAIVSDGTTSLTTPATLKLKRDKDYVLTISKPGYETQNVKITHVISGAVAGNLLAGGLIGWGVDAMSGAQWRLVPETVAVNLRPLDGNTANVSTDPAAKLEELEALKQKGSITEKEYTAMKDLLLQTTPA